MKELNHCPSTLADGFSTYSPTACKKLFDGQKVSHLLDFEIDEISKTSETMIAMRRISVSGAQEKFPAVIENGIIRISQTDERSRYILKPAPWDNTSQRASYHADSFTGIWHHYCRKWPLLYPSWRHDIYH